MVGQGCSKGGDLGHSARQGRGPRAAPLVNWRPQQRAAAVWRPSAGRSGLETEWRLWGAQPSVSVGV